MPEAIKLALADGLFDIKNGKEKALLEALKRCIESGQEINHTKLGKELQVGKERVGQLFTQIGTRLVKNGYISLEELRQNGIQLTPRLKKELDRPKPNKGREL